MLRTVACAHRHLAPEHERDIAAATEHVSCLADLVEQLVGGHPHEVGVHQFHDGREAPVEGDATPKSAEGVLTDRRAEHPVGIGLL